MTTVSIRHWGRRESEVRRSARLALAVFGDRRAVDAH